MDRQNTTFKHKLKSLLYARIQESLTVVSLVDVTLNLTKRKINIINLFVQ